MKRRKPDSGSAGGFGRKALPGRTRLRGGVRRVVCMLAAVAGMQGLAADGKGYDEVLADGSNAERVALAKSYEAAGGEPNAVKAVRLYHAAASEGDAEAQCGMSRLYNEGRGVRARPEKAYAWALAAARQGHAEAQNLVGVYLSDGDGVEADANAAAEWFRKAAFQGNVKAQFNFGACFEDGAGVPQSDAQAVQWYRAAAESGCAPAQTRLGACLERGAGAPRDVAQAAAWYARAAAAGDADGQFAFGRCLERGIGVVPEPSEALAWYRKAEAQGDARARHRIRFLQDEAAENPKQAQEADGRLGLAGLRLGMPIETAAIVLERALNQAGSDAMLFVAGAPEAPRVAWGREVEILGDAAGAVTSIYLDRGTVSTLLGLQNPTRSQLFQAAATAAGFEPAGAVQERRSVSHRGRQLGVQAVDVLKNPAGDSLVCFGSYAGAALPAGADVFFKPLGSILLK